MFDLLHKSVAQMVKKSVHDHINSATQNTPRLTFSKSLYLKLLKS